MTTALATHAFLGKVAVPADSACAFEANCMGSGWCMADDGNVTACGCEHGRRGRSTWARLKSGIPRDAYEWAALEVPDDAYGKIIGQLEGYVTGFNRRAPGGLILSGAAGRGKTRLMGAVAAALVETGVTVRWRRWDDLLRTIKAGFDSKGPTEREAIDEALSCRLLCLDDVGADASLEGTEWTQSLLCGILDAAIRESVGLAITTNLTGAAIKERYGERVTSRLLEASRPDRGGLAIKFLPAMNDFRAAMHGKRGA